MVKLKLQVLLDGIIKDVVTPPLKKLSFKKSARNYYREFNGFGWCFNVQSSLYNDDSEVRFTFNTGLFVPRAYQLYFNEEVPNFPKEYQCLQRRRIGSLKEKGDIWYTLINETNISELKGIISQDINDYVVPYFMKFDSIDKIITELYQEHENNGDPQHIAQLSILLILNQRESEGLNLLTKQYNNAKNDSYKEWLKEVANRVKVKLES